MTQHSATRETRRVIVLGSTGSIGVNALEVIDHLTAERPGSYEVVGLAARGNGRRLREQAARYPKAHLALADPDQAASFGADTPMSTGPEAARELVENVAQAGDLLLGAIVGSAGLPATLAAIDRGCNILLANKETLVAAGSLVMPRVRERGVELLPVDSEHSALAQCLRSGRGPEEVKRIVLTASGGPFRQWPIEKMAEATVDEALNHPTWKMGPKITIDSATMMNKALEVIEAHWLFDLPAEQIEVIIHPPSIVHSFVEFVDGSVIAQLGPPDMRTPIQYALTWPERVAGCSSTLDWGSLRRLDFEPVDEERFPSISLAYEVIRTGGTAGAILNGANEAAVEAFLAGRMRFGAIVELVREALGELPISSIDTLEDVLDADRAARRFVEDRLTASPSKRTTEPVRSATRQ